MITSQFWTRTLAAIAMLAVGTTASFAAAFDDGANFYKRGNYQAALNSWRNLSQTDATVQNNIGIMYKNGQGVARNMPLAAQWLARSAANGSSLGQNNLGGLYREGKGVPRDYPKAAQWFAASAAQGNTAAMYNLGLMYELGQGMKAEPFHAYMWYALAAEQNSIENAAAHRNALWNRMTPAAQKQAKEMTATCKSMAYKGCR